MEERMLKEGDVIRFDLLQIERNKRKDCTCTTPRFMIDTQNRRISCLGCGAIWEAFDAMEETGRHVEELKRLVELKKEYKAYVGALERQADELEKKRDRLRQEIAELDRLKNGH